LSSESDDEGEGDDEDEDEDGSSAEGGVACFFRGAFLTVLLSGVSSDEESEDDDDEDEAKRRLRFRLRFRGAVGLVAGILCGGGQRASNTKQAVHLLSAFRVVMLRWRPTSGQARTSRFLYLLLELRITLSVANAGL